MRLKKLDCERKSCSHLSDESRLICQYKCISEPCYAEIYGHDEVFSLLAPRLSLCILCTPHAKSSALVQRLCPMTTLTRLTIFLVLLYSLLYRFSSRRARWTQSAGGFSDFAIAVFTGRKWRRGRSVCARRQLSSELGCLEE